MSVPVETRTRRDLGVWLKYGVIGGLIGGVVFALYEMAAAAVTMGVGAALMPLRMIAAIVLGPAALEAGYPLATVVVVGVLVHLVLATAFGVVFGLLIGGMPTLTRSSTALIVLASVFGLMLWGVNFYLIAPVAGWPWFPENTNPLNQIIAHTFFYGTVLGVVIDRMAGPRPDLAGPPRSTA